MSRTIRLARASDAHAVQKIYAPIVRDTATSFELEPPDRSEMARRIRATLDNGLPWLVCDADGRVDGYVYAGPHRGARAAYQWSVEVSVYVHGATRRAGVATALYTSLFEVLRLQGYQNVYAGAALPNAASVRLHESLGFRRVGIYESVGYKLGAWHDVLWWVLRIGSHPADPPAPIDLGRAASLPGWEAALAAGTDREEEGT